MGIFRPHLLQLPTEPTGGACLTHDGIRERPASAQGPATLANPDPDPDPPVPDPSEGVADPSDTAGSPLYFLCI